MIKIIGFIFIAAGAVLLAATIVKGKKDGIEAARKELSLILDAGYADTHKEAKKGARLDPKPSDNRVKTAPRKRTLSKEAKDILALVEKEKAEGKNYDPKPEGDGTAVMPEKKTEKGTPTDVLRREEKTEGTGTDILRKETAASESTDILKKTPESTDILRRDKAEGTDILKRETIPAEKTDVLRKKPGQKKERDEEGGSTDILPGKKIAKSETENGTGILERRK